MTCFVCGKETALPLCDACRSADQVVLSILGYLLTHPGETDYLNQPAFHAMIAQLPQAQQQEQN